MEKKLIEKLKNIQKSLSENRTIGIRKLEEMKTETKRAFDSAIEKILSKKDVLKEIKEKRIYLLRWRISFVKTVFPLNVRHIISMPFIYGVFLPALIFHVFIEVYHQVCFRLYNIPLVSRKEYFVYDRHLLPYLNWFEKLNCIYCSYVNNLLKYTSEIAGRTERYWCPIKYAKRTENNHSQYEKFFDYLDAQHFREEWKNLRNFNDIREENKQKNCDFIKQ